MNAEVKLKKQIVQNKIDEAIKKHEFGCFSVLWIKHGEEQFFVNGGWQSIEKEIPIARNSIFRLCSMTKPVTGAAAMILMQDGLFDLYDPVFKYIPAFQNQYVQTQDGLVPALEPIRIKDLLNMTSGLVYGGSVNQAEVETTRVLDNFIERMDTNCPMTSDEYATAIARCPLGYQPGSSWKYSCSADILGIVIEKIVGKRYGEFLKERLFDPLGMKDTGFSVSLENRDRLTSPYVYHEQRNKKEGKLSLYSGEQMGVTIDGRANTIDFGGAGLFSTIDDYAKFAQMLLNNGNTVNGESILREKTLKFYTSHCLEDKQQESFKKWLGMDGYTYGNYLRILKSPEKAGVIGSQGEYGWDGWMGTYFVNDPENDQTVLMFTQRTDYGTQDFTREIRNIIFS